jgi:hypothetical protein
MSLAELVESLRVAVHTKQSKNVDVLHLSARICRRMNGKQLHYLSFPVALWSLENLGCLFSRFLNLPF